MKGTNQMISCGTGAMFARTRCLVRYGATLGLMTLMFGCAAQSSKLDVADDANDSTMPALRASPSASASGTMPSGKGGGLASEARQRSEQVMATTTSDTGIYYHGGAVMPVVDIYYIFYGNWSSSQIGILTDFAQHIGDSPYFNINKTYPGVSGHAVHGGSTSYPTSMWGTSLNDSTIAGIVTFAINHGDLPYDANGVYFVLTDEGVAETDGFCSSFCGWHTWSHLNWFGGPTVRFAFIGNPARCPGNCMASFNQSVSPNGDPGMDGMISVIAHELDETTTDPDLNAWYDNANPSNENADKCAWNFGATYPAANGSTANMRLGARDYLIQENWVNLPGCGCRLQSESCPPPPPPPPPPQCPASKPVCCETDDAGKCTVCIPRTQSCP